MGDEPSEASGGVVESVSETFSTRYDWFSTPPSTAVIEAVAAVRDTKPTDMPPLYPRVDPDALDSMFERAAGFDGGDVRISFSYAAREVAVVSDGAILITPQSAVV